MSNKKCSLFIFGMLLCASSLANNNYNTLDVPTSVGPSQLPAFSGDCTSQAGSAILNCMTGIPIKPNYNSYATATYIGDSYTAPSCGGAGPPNCWVTILNGNVGLTGTNLAVSGSQVAEVVQQLYTQNITTGSLLLGEVGVNDSRFYLDAIKQGVYQAALFNIYAYGAIPNSNKLTAQNSGVTYSGTCTTYNPWTGALWNTEKCTSVGSTISFKFYGSTGYISSIVNGSATANNATYSVTIDGVNQGTFSNNPGEDITSQNGIVYAGIVNRFSGFAKNTFHNVVITALTIPDANSFISFDWAAGNQGNIGQIGPTIVLGNVVRRTSAGYATYGGSDISVTQLNNIISNVSKTLYNDGLNIGLADWAANLNPATGLSGDGLHPNAAGYGVLANTAQGQLSSGVGGQITQGAAANTWNIKSGSLIVQNIATNASWIGENAYYNGTNFVNPVTGKSSFLYSNSGAWEIRTNALSNTAGTNLNSTMFTNLQVYGGLFGIGGNVTPGVCCAVTNFDLYNTLSHIITVPNNKLSLPGTSTTGVELGISNWGAQANSTLAMLMMENCQYISGFTTIITGGCSAINQNVNEIGLVMFPPAAAGTNNGGGATAEKFKINLDGTFAVGPSMSTAIGVYTGANLTVQGISGHIIYGGTAPVVSACGTSPSIESHSTDQGGTVTVGSTATSCTITFNTAYTTYAHCNVTSQQNLVAFAYSYTKTAITISATALGGDIVDYRCDGS